MQFEAKCQAVVAFNSIIKALLTVEDNPHNHEHVLLNILSERIPLEQGKAYRISIEAVE
jgi:hypothetical protein